MSFLNSLKSGWRSVKDRFTKKDQTFEAPVVPKPSGDRHSRPGYVKNASKPMHPNSLCQICMVQGANQKWTGNPSDNLICWKKECKDAVRLYTAQS
jgi:hypothetical protein